MSQFIDEASSAAWSLWKAGMLARQCRNHVRLATFERDAQLAQTPAMIENVPVIGCPIADGAAYSSGLPQAVTLLDRELGFTINREDSRLLVIITDNALDEKKNAHSAVDRMRRAGVNVAWINVDDDTESTPGATHVRASDLHRHLPHLVVDALASATPRGYL